MNSVCYESHNDAETVVLMATFLQYVMVTQVGKADIGKVSQCIREMRGN